MTDEQVEKSAEEQAAQQQLQDKGIVILEEVHNEESPLTYLVKCKHMDSGNTFEAAGEDRTAALKAAVVMANASA